MRSYPYTFAAGVMLAFAIGRFGQGRVPEALVDLLMCAVAGAFAVHFARQGR